MKRIAIFPGSFDPITLGHVHIINKAHSLFDHIIIAIGYNTSKKGMFDVELRKKWVQEIFKDIDNVSVEAFSGLTVDFCQKKNANFILRGLRNSADFEFEKAMAHTNKSLIDTIETVFLMTEPEYSYISSSFVREVLKNNGDCTKFIHPLVIEDIALNHKI